MDNNDTAAARRYHDATKHSLARLQAEPHYLDWEIKPLPFKVYPHLEAIALPRQLSPCKVSALDAVSGAFSATAEPQVPDLHELARLLHFCAGITRKKTYPDGQEHHFRAAACTGALYHIDLYVICSDLAGLAAGVYHFGPHNFSLYRLRDGDHRAALVTATGGEPSSASAPVLLACVSTYWRNAWKYRSRAYRHCFWDTGTILANLFSVAAADGVRATLVSGFVDKTVGSLLGLDAAREAATALVSIGKQATPNAPAPLEMPELVLETLPLSAAEIDYPLIRETHAAGFLATPEEVRIWRDPASSGSRQTTAPAPAQRDRWSLRPLVGDALPDDSIDSVITRRGSSRRFAPLPMSFEQLSTILERSTHGTAADYGDGVNDLYLIVNAVDGLPPGTYVYHSDTHSLEQLRAGELRREAEHLGLGQDLPRDAAVNVYFLCGLDDVLERFGNRGYRVAQLDAAIAAGRMYLAAYALRLGATGLTFLDDDVTRFFSPHAAGKSVMFLMAIGRAQRPQLATA